MTCDLLAARTNRCETNETAYIVDPLESSVSYSARSNNVNLVHWPLIGELLYLVQRGGDWPLFAVPNVTAHPSTASVPVTVLLYNGSLLCSFNVGIEGLTIYADFHL